MQTERKKEIAKELLNLGVVKIQLKEPFLYRSGLKGPLMTDCRKILANVPLRQLISATFLAELNSNQVYSNPLLAAVATAGLPWASFLAHELKWPMIYFRSKSSSVKLEGDFKAGQNVVLIDDLINQASNVRDAIFLLKEKKLELKNIFSIVNYQIPSAQKKLLESGARVFSATDLDAILAVALENKMITKDEWEKVIEWKNDPKDWSKKNMIS